MNGCVLSTHSKPDYSSSSPNTHQTCTSPTELQKNLFQLRRVVPRGSSWWMEVGFRKRDCPALTCVCVSVSHPQHTSSKWWTTPMTKTWTRCVRCAETRFQGITTDYWPARAARLVPSSTPRGKAINCWNNIVIMKTSLMSSIFQSLKIVFGSEVSNY